MNRRSFIKGLIALASAPAIGKYVNIFKTQGAQEGIGQIAGQGVDFFNMVIKKVMDEGTLVNESDRIQTFRHPDRPDLNVEVDLGTGNASVSFATDQGTEGLAAIEKDLEVGMTDPGELIDEGLEGGITNLQEFLRNKNKMFRGGVPKGLEAALRAIMGKFGDDAITTTDTIPRPQQVIEAEETAQAIKDFNTRNPAYDPTDPFTTNKQAQDEFIRNEMDIAVRESEIENASPGFTGDMKYDAQVLADSFAEERFGKEFYDLPLKLQMSLYDEAYQALSQQFIKYSKFKNVTKPEKTLAAMKAGKGIDMSDPDIASEFTRFMQESDPSGFKDVEEKVELMNFNPKGRKKNADGGSVDGDVSLTVIKIPDISESGVESLFKRR